MSLCLETPIRTLTFRPSPPRHPALPSSPTGPTFSKATPQQQTRSKASWPSPWSLTATDRPRRGAGLLDLRRAGVELHRHGVWSRLQDHDFPDSDRHCPISQDSNLTLLTSSHDGLGFRFGLGLRLGNSWAHLLLEQTPEVAAGPFQAQSLIRATAFLLPSKKHPTVRVQPLRIEHPLRQRSMPWRKSRA